ncbi:MAG: nicotinate (nicotinamide) nucleotide adenylyltransferase [Chloroflexi bacterium]|nr:nicotinate (nicotinamide) nucleotide adenylyltransferase [Chloroflexota bacterium]
MTQRNASPLAILGGTFDPPHIGHLVLGECARLQFGASRVVYIPAGDPWRKTAADAARRRAVTAAVRRLAMVRLAVAGNPGFVVDDREVRRLGPTYTVETLEALHAEGHRELLLIVGTDALADFPNWHRSADITRLARIVVAEKPGAEGTAAKLAQAAGFDYAPGLVAMPPLPISSTDIRNRATTGKPFRYLVPEPVFAYIRGYGLYGVEASPA